jgi:hypothetical protein
LGLARRVEIAERAPGSSGHRSGHQHQPASSRHQSSYDYPIVKHHPLFAKSSKGHGSGISSLLLGENIEFMRKPGRSLSHGVQSVRRSTPKLLTFEIYNPETDDLDSDTSHSSSPDSDDSIISVIADCCLHKKSSIGASGSHETKVQTSGCDSSTFLPTTSKMRLPSLPEISPPASTESSCEQLCPADHVSSVPGIAAKTQSPDKDELLPASPLLLHLSLEEIDRKSEERTKGLLSLLGENKTVLENISVAKRQRTVGSSERIGVTVPASQTAAQLRSLEELWLPRSKSCSPDKMSCLPGIGLGSRLNEASAKVGVEPIKLGSLDSVIGLNSNSKTSRSGNNINCVAAGPVDSEDSNREQRPSIKALKATEMRHL